MQNETTQAGFTAAADQADAAKQRGIDELRADMQPYSTTLEERIKARIRAVLSNEFGGVDSSVVVRGLCHAAASVGDPDFKDAWRDTVPNDPADRSWRDSHDREPEPAAEKQKHPGCHGPILSVDPITKILSSEIAERYRPVDRTAAVMALRMAADKLESDAQQQ